MPHSPEKRPRYQKEYRAMRFAADPAAWRACANERMKKWNAKCRAEVIEALGGKCVRCGFSDPRALQIDHVNGDGWKNKGLTPRQGQYCREVVSQIGQGKHQLLCANCNWIKRAENGEHS